MKTTEVIAAKGSRFRHEPPVQAEPRKHDSRAAHRMHSAPKYLLRRCGTCRRYQAELPVGQRCLHAALPVVMTLPVQAPPGINKRMPELMHERRASGERSMTRILARRTDPDVPGIR